MIVTAHACQRFVERVAPSMTLAEASEAIAASAKAVEAAASFGCHLVRQGCGAGLVLKGTTVVTVVGRGQRTRDMIPPRLQLAPECRS